jgi:2,5-diamino-6-(ribosylamino)-4(3H)-pyrimidinone 5'-phosphate reductase
MMTSVDGRIVVDRWPPLGDGRAEYERTAATYDANAWMCGRITMEPFAGGLRDTDELEREGAARNTPCEARGDFIASGGKREADMPVRYAIAIDPSGRLLWKTNEIDGDHVVTVLTDRVSDDYLAQLRDRGVSYLFATRSDGSDVGEVDLALALEKLGATFGIRTILLEGGGGINGSMLRDGLIDEVSVLIAPVADGGVGTPSLFDVDREGPRNSARHLALESVERRAADTLWLRYRVDDPAE